MKWELLRRVSKGDGLCAREWRQHFFKVVIDQHYPCSPSQTHASRHAAGDANDFGSDGQI